MLMDKNPGIKIKNTMKNVIILDVHIIARLYLHSKQLLICETGLLSMHICNVLQNVFDFTPEIKKAYLRQEAAGASQVDDVSAHCFV